MATASPAPVMVSCRAGRDRTGMVIALLLDLVGIGRDIIAADYTHLDEQGTNAAPALPDHRRHGAVDILQMLGHVSAVHGSAYAYLRWLGLHDAAVSALRQRLLP